MSDARTEKNQTVVYNPRKRPVYILGESLRPRGVSTPENVLKKTTLRTKKTRGWECSYKLVPSKLTKLVGFFDYSRATLAGYVANCQTKLDVAPSLTSYMYALTRFPNFRDITVDFVTTHP